MRTYRRGQMKRCLFISLGSSNTPDRILLSWWVDYLKSSRSRFVRKGHFDVERWEDAQTHIEAVLGCNPRTAWKAAWRLARIEARSYDCFQVL